MTFLKSMRLVNYDISLQAKDKYLERDMKCDELVNVLDEYEIAPCDGCKEYFYYDQLAYPDHENSRQWCEDCKTF